MNKSIPELIEIQKDQAFAKNYNWIRTSITILTAALSLLIGLQETLNASSPIKLYSLLALLTLMTLTILVGLLALRGEAKQHLQKEVVLYKLFENNSYGEAASLHSIDLPKIYYYALIVFPTLAALSILSLGIFGILKFTLH